MTSPLSLLLLPSFRSVFTINDKRRGFPVADHCLIFPASHLAPAERSPSTRMRESLPPRSAWSCSSRLCKALEAHFPRMQNCLFVCLFVFRQKSDTILMLLVNCLFDTHHQLHYSCWRVSKAAGIIFRVFYSH